MSSNYYGRVLSRTRARELTVDEVARIYGAGTNSGFVGLTVPPGKLDVQQDPGDPTE